MAMEGPLLLTPHLSSSDLTATCLHSVELRHAGKRIATMPTAMFRGALFDAAACKWHTDRFDPPMAVLFGMENVLREAKESGQPVTGAAFDERYNIADEVTKALYKYVERVAPMFTKVIGVQIPVRFTLDVDGEPQDFASHIDLMWRDAGKVLHIADWKWREESPTQAYLDRNLQFALYRLCAFALDGWIQIDGEWTQFNEDAVMEWIHIPALFPYARGTGEFKKGDERPLDRIVIAAGDGPLDWAIEELKKRTRMARQGLWPTNPDPVGCHICMSKQFCASSYRSNQ